MLEKGIVRLDIVYCLFLLLGSYFSESLICVKQCRLVPSKIVAGGGGGGGGQSGIFTTKEYDIPMKITLKRTIFTMKA